MEKIKDGYTRVSTILDFIPSIIPNGGEEKIKWGFPMQSIPEDILNRKAQIGTRVHEAINAWKIDDFYALNDEEKGYFESFQKWKDFMHLKPVHSELRLYNEPMMITGAIDMVCKIKESENLILIDFKTSASCDPKKWLLQAAFYHELLQYNGIETQPNVLFLKLDKRGDMPNVNIFTINTRAKKCMICAYNLYKFLTEK